MCGKNILCTLLCPSLETIILKMLSNLNIAKDTLVCYSIYVGPDYVYVRIFCWLCLSVASEIQLPTIVKESY